MDAARDGDSASDATRDTASDVAEDAHEFDASDVVVDAHEFDASDDAAPDTADEAATDAAPRDAPPSDATDALVDDRASDTGVDVPAPRFVVGGMLRGLTAGTITLRNNGGDDLPLSADGMFRFAQPLLSGERYAVTIETRPANHQCLVSAGATGTVAGADVTSVVVDCAVSGSRLFARTGAPETFVVPAGVSTISIEAWGAEGAPSDDVLAIGGSGGYASGTLDVMPGQSLTVTVGGQDGFNGGGASFRLPASCRSTGGSGGGASDVRVGAATIADRVIVAAGGGGAGGNQSRLCTMLGGMLVNMFGSGGGGGGGYYGGGGGGVDFDDGTTLAPTGGTQTAGGRGGGTLTRGNPGVLGGGGGGDARGATLDPLTAVAGAGGGGGGGLAGQDGRRNGTNRAYSGAGGSSYIGGVRDGVTRDAERRGDGQVRLRW